MSEETTALQAILAQLQAFEALARKPYASVINSGIKNVSNTVNHARLANELAVKTVVQNLGAQDVWVFEDASLVAIVPSGKSWESFGGGTGAIDVTTKAGTGLTSTCIVITYLSEPPDDVS